MSVHQDSYLRFLLFRLKNRKTEPPPPSILSVKRVFCSMGNKDLADLRKFLRMAE